MAEENLKDLKLPVVIGKLLAPLPLFPLQFILSRMVKGITQRRPEFFARLGPHIGSSYALDVTELPFVLLLKPNPQKPEMTAHRRSEKIASDASISGPFMDLFKVLDGRGDSDAMFFSGNIKVSGNTEAAVCLRYALDDLEGSVIEDLLHMGGPVLMPAHLLLQRLRRLEIQT
ncbi:MAG: SCP2 sterol-binding domain-containing protein [Rhizobiales bacterium]|jgi:predicted lipid carrier protein YhbT|nr:SCP2 sterol-binding domain-containing protein [Hyphomicrobiales bacterium]MBP9173351.1 SCP2 sterol-binding domain-containing protein [Hyphomicrobiales bacterium]